MAGMPMLKSILKWSIEQGAAHGDGTDGGGLGDAATPMSEEDRKWLQEAMSQIVMDETERMNEAVQVLEYARAAPAAAADGAADDDEAKPTIMAESKRQEGEQPVAFVLARASAAELAEMKVAALDELTQRVEQVDNARFFACGHGGSGKLPLLLDLVRDGDAKLQWRAAEALATVLQNNPSAQSRAMEVNALPALMAVVSDGEAAPKLRTKAFFALSCLLRGADTVRLAAFLAAGGLELMRGLLQPGAVAELRLLRKAVFFLHYVGGASSAAAQQVVAAGLVPSLLAMVRHDDADISEKAVSVLQVLANDAVVCGALLAGNDAKAVVEAHLAALQQTPEEEKEWVEQPIEQCRQLLRTFAACADSGRRAAVPAATAGGGGYVASVPTAAAATVGSTYGAQIDAWRAAKEAEWAQQGSKLRTKLPERAKFDAWMERQCAKALGIKRQQQQARQAAAEAAPLLLTADNLTDQPLAISSSAHNA